MAIIHRKRTFSDAARRAMGQGDVRPVLPSEYADWLSLHLKENKASLFLYHREPVADSVFTICGPGLDLPELRGPTALNLIVPEKASVRFSALGDSTLLFMEDGRYVAAPSRSLIPLYHDVLPVLVQRGYIAAQFSLPVEPYRQYERVNRDFQHLMAGLEGRPVPEQWRAPVKSKKLPRKPRLPSA